MVKNKQNIILAVLGYDRKFDYYNKIKNDLTEREFFEVKLIYVDNKTSIIYNKEKSIINLDPNEANNFFEFTGYFILLKECLKIIEDKNYDAIILMNDTATNHHFWPLWKYIIRRSLKNTNVGNILGDLRWHSESEDNNKFLASWIFIFSVHDLKIFNNNLKLTIDSVSKNSEYYNRDNIEEYASHLEHDKRIKLLDWLFNPSLFGGWTESTNFIEMEKLTRYRKGVTIELEHALSDSLQKASLTLVDIKNIFLWTNAVNFLDRVINQCQRFINKYIKFIS
jgi:hypothetical protein